MQSREQGAVVGLERPYPLRLILGDEPRVAVEFTTRMVAVLNDLVYRSRWQVVARRW